MIELRAGQRRDTELMDVPASELAEHGPAFTAVELGGVEQDEDGHVARVLACAGLAEYWPVSHPSGGRAMAWASFAEGLGARDMRFVTAAIRGVLGGCRHARVEMACAEGFAAAGRYAVALGFRPTATIYARKLSVSGAPGEQ